MVFIPIHTYLVLTWHDGACLIPCEGHLITCEEEKVRRWKMVRRKAGCWWGEEGGRSGHVQLFPGQVLNSRKRTLENFFTSEGESTWASSLPLAPLPSWPLVRIYPSLLAFISLLLSSSILPCYLLSLFLFTVVSLHPFLLFSPSSFTFPSYPQSSRLSIGPLRSLRSKYFPGIEIDWDVSFKTVQVLELRTAVGGRMGHAQEQKAQPHSGHNSSLVFLSGKYGDSDQHAAPVSALPAPEASAIRADNWWFFNR